MKPLFSLLACAFLAGSLKADDYRTFTSADGSKTLEAKLSDYNATTGVMSLRLKNGRSMKASTDHFTEADKTYAQETMEVITAGRKLQVSIEDYDEKVKEAKNPSAGSNTITRNAGFKIELRNNGTVPVTGVVAKYKVFLSKDTGPGANEQKIETGDLKFEDLQPRNEATLQTKDYTMTSVRPLSAKECAGGT